MPTMRTHPGFVCVFVAFLPACTDLSYRELQLGQTPQQYDRTLPTENSRRTDRGLCHLTVNQAGRTDAIVVLLAADRRIAAKLRATLVERDYGWKKERSFTLEGDVDLKLASLGAVGPFDAIRAILADLETDPGEQFVKDAHAWVIAALYRLLQRWPHLAESPAAPPGISDTLDRVPADGAASISIDSRGVLHLGYQWGTPR